MVFVGVFGYVPSCSAMFGNTLWISTETVVSFACDHVDELYRLPGPYLQWVG